MNRKTAIYFFILFLSFVSVQSNAQSLKTSQADTDTLISHYQEEEFGFLYNINWTLDTSSDESVNAMLKYFYPEPGFMSNINFILQYIGENDTIDLESALLMSKMQMEEYIPEFKSGKAEYVMVGGDTAIQWEFTGKLNDISLHWLQQYSVQNGRMLISTFTSSEQLYYGHVPEVKRIFQTAKLHKK